jgi:hypothetical protein
MSDTYLPIETFWQEIYARTGLSEEKVTPRQLSILLDQGQRHLCNVLGVEEMPELVTPVELSVADGGDYVDTHGDLLTVAIKGPTGFYYLNDPYLDSGGSLSPEVHDVIAVAFAEEGGGETTVLHYGNRVTFEEMARRNDDDAADYYVDQAEQGYKWCFADGKLYLWPLDNLEYDIGSTDNMRLWISWYPERFLGSDDRLKTAFVNDSLECELPSRYLPMLTDWVVRKLLIASGNADLVQAAMQDTQMGIMASREKAAKEEAGPWTGQK